MAQECAAKLRKLEREKTQLASAYKLIKENHERTVKDLRDAEVYIQLLEDENELFQQRISELEGGSNE